MIDKKSKLQPQGEATVVQIWLPADVVAVLQLVQEKTGLSIQSVAVDILRDSLSAYKVFDIPGVIRAVRKPK